MTRPAGVTVSAVFLIIGSMLTILMCLSMLFADRLAPLETSQAPSEARRTMIAALMLFAGAVWGVVTSIGLFRMRHWARVCILVMGAIVVIFCGLMLLMFLLLPGLIPPFESDEESRIVTGIVFGVCLIPIAAGIWWLTYFNRAAVKAEFLEGFVPKIGPCRPLSITVIAWHAIAFGLGTLGFLAMGSSPYVFGIALTGWAAALTNAALGSIELVIGIGLLKLKPWGLTTAVWFCIFTMVQTLVSAFLSDQDPRLAAWMEQISQEIGTYSMRLPEWSHWIVPAIVWGTFGVALWYLYTRKKAFLEAGKAAQSVG